MSTSIKAVEFPRARSSRLTAAKRGLTLLLAAMLIPPLGLGQVSRLDGPADKKLAAERNAIEAQLESVAIIDRKVMMPMRDGVRLATDIYRPKDQTKRYPTVFVRMPYNFNYWDVKLGAFADMQKPLEAVRRGYAYVIQDERGQYFSEGNWHILGAPRTDGYDAFSWIAKQPWSNGRVAPVGCSSMGEWQMGVAALGNPAETTMIPQGYGAGIGHIGPFYEQGTWYRGGAIVMEMILFLYESQNTQRPMFSPNISQQDMIRLSRYFDLQPQWPGADWSMLSRHLPVGDIIRSIDGPLGIFADREPGPGGKPFVERTPDDPAWSEGGLFQEGMRINMPALWLASWYDLSVAPNIELFNYVQKTASPEIARQQRLIIAPVQHCRFGRETAHTMVGQLDVGDARYGYDNLVWGWLDHYLKGVNNGLPESQPPITYYELGKNEWRTTTTWPPPHSRQLTLYLASSGGANTLTGDGRIEVAPPRRDWPDQFTYDPQDPVPSLGGHFCCVGGAQMVSGAFDQRPIEARRDVLVYSSDPLTHGIDATGPITVDLWVSSDRRDTDFTVKLIDVYPDGRAFNLDDTIQRVRYRDGYTRAKFMSPGRIYRVTLGPMVTSNWFAPGHRIRLEVSSSNFPSFERNLNTGGRNWDEKTGLIARNSVHHSATYPSRFTLTVLP